MKIRLRHDWIRVVIEPEPEVPPGGVMLTGVQPVRIARVVAAGPGRHFPDGKFIPMGLKIGDRFPFFKAASETKQGHALAMLLDDNEAVLRETDVLFVLEGEGHLKVSL